MLLDEDLLLKIDAIAHLHKLVGVARVAVLAGKLASAIRIDRPRERQISFADNAIQERARTQCEVFDIVSLAQGFPRGGHACNADELGLWVVAEVGEERESSHWRFPGISPYVRLE